MRDERVKALTWHLIYKVRQAVNFHFGKKYTKSSFEKAMQKGQISAQDSEIIQNYISEMIALHQLSENREMKISTTLLGWRKK